MANIWPSEEHLRQRLDSLISPPSGASVPSNKEWRGTAFRFASQKYADLHTFTDGVGAQRNGGRFTPIGGPRTVYLSVDPRTAVDELMYWHDYTGVPLTAFEPHVLAAVDVEVGVVLDVSDPGVLAHLGLTAHHASEDWRPMSKTGSATAQTQLFGKLVFESGFEGILFPSARRPSGFNLALFPNKFSATSHAVMRNYVGS